MSDSKDGIFTGPHVVPLGQEPSDMEKSLEYLRHNLPTILAYNELMAKIVYEKYTALKKVGFNDIQALELCGGSL